MLELGPFGSVRGVSGNGPPYRDPRPNSDKRHSPFFRNPDFGLRSECGLIAALRNASGLRPYLALSVSSDCGQDSLFAAGLFIVPAEPIAHGR